jgi:hypothetical protein
MSTGVWLIAVILLLIFVVLVFLEWALRKWWNNGPANLEHEVVWRSRPTYYNPSLIPSREKEGSFWVACRRSPFAHRDLFDLIANYAYFRCRQSCPDEMHIFHLDAVTGQEEKWKKLNPPWLPCMKYALYEDPRIHQLEDGSFCILATFVNKLDVRVKPQAILKLDSEWNIVHAVPLDHRRQPQPCFHKNWTLFTDGEGELCLLSDIAPMVRIQHVNLETGTYSVKHEYLSPLTDHHKVIRCTSSPVRWDSDTLITAAHTVVYKGISHTYQTVFVWFSNRPPYSIQQWTQPLTCFSDSYVEFPSGLVYEHTTDSFLLGLGLNDIYAIIVRLSRNTLLKHVVVSRNSSNE